MGGNEATGVAPGVDMTASDRDAPIDPVPLARTETALRARPSARRRAMFWTILVLLALGLIEGSAYAMCRIILASSGAFLLWHPDLDAARRNWIAGAADVDDELGWPAPAAATRPPRDATGAKSNAEFPEPSRACASAYGDSFIWGEDVLPADGWIEQLSHRLGCRVANYGVSGYGTDQAYLRFRRTTADEAPLVLLGIFPENAIRNVNQYRAFAGYALHPGSLKGRFVLDAAGRLAWVPRSRLDAEGFVTLNRTPAAVLPNEYLLPDTRDGPVTLRFPYTLTLLNVALKPRVWARFAGRPSWSAFYAADHPAGALALTAAIAEAFAREAQRRGKKALVVMLPGASSFRGRAKHGSFEYASLTALLGAQGVEVFDPGPALLAELGDRSYCELYVRPQDCDGHYGVFGSTIVADVVAAELRRRNLVRP
jgi:hypothetical protein